MTGLAKSKGPIGALVQNDKRFCRVKSRPLQVVIMTERGVIKIILRCRQQAHIRPFRRQRIFSCDSSLQSLKIAVSLCLCVAGCANSLATGIIDLTGCTFSTIVLLGFKYHFFYGRRRHIDIKGGQVHQTVALGTHSAIKRRDFLRRQQHFVTRAVVFCPVSLRCPVVTNGYRGLPPGRYS